MYSAELLDDKSNFCLFLKVVISNLNKFFFELFDFRFGLYYHFDNDRVSSRQAV